MQIEFDYYIPASVTVASDGTITDWSEVYTFDNSIDRFLLSTATGTGMPDIEYITQRGPYQHGETVLDYRLRPRTIQLNHRRNACDRYSYWEVRADMLNLMRPNYHLGDQFGPGRLRKILPDGSIRDIYVLFDDGLPFSSSSSVWDEFSVEEQIRWIAHDPIFFNPDGSSQEWTLTDLDHWILPWTFPGEFLFGSGVLSETIDITYTGTWLTYPTVVFVGPMITPRIENLTTDEKIELNYIIPSGRYVTVDLGYGNKTVTDDLGTNLFGVITSDSDLAEFHLAPHPEATNGVNQIRVVASGLTVGVSSVYLYWNEKYIGM